MICGWNGGSACFFSSWGTAGRPVSVVRVSAHGYTCLLETPEVGPGHTRLPTWGLVSPLGPHTARTAQPSSHPHLHFGAQSRRGCQFRVTLRTPGTLGTREERTQALPVTLVKGTRPSQKHPGPSHITPTVCQGRGRHNRQATGGDTSVFFHQGGVGKGSAEQTGSLRAGRGHAGARAHACACVWNPASDRAAARLRGRRRCLRSLFTFHTQLPRRV